MSLPPDMPASPVQLSYSTPSRDGLVAPKSRARAIVVLCAINIVISIFVFVFLLMQRGLLDRAIQGQRPTAAEADANDLRVTTAAGLQTLVAVSMFVVLLCWIYRIYKNMITMRMSPSMSAGWAVGAWFIPIFNLFRSFQIMREMLVLNGHRQADSDHLATAWWVAWFGSMLVPIILRVSRISGDLLENLLAQTESAMVGTAIGIVATALVAVLVRRVQGYQENEIRNFATDDVVPFAAAVSASQPVNG